MSSILHRITIEAPPEQVYKAITEQEQLSAWWTRADAQAKAGSKATFYFGPSGEHQVNMEITDLKINERICWKCIEGPWVETGEFRFHIVPDDRGSILEFSHSGWEDANEFFMHCNSKWGFFLTVSLKNLLETGVGQPHPNDPDI